ncbi:MAG: 3-hydroxybutyryl-CoA dehydrogenase [Caldilineales bacterium]|nr:3-hydroxybutyryl-CoA dehydrogenase [Caldilineales bacterium]
MGSGIVEVCARAGFDVIVAEADEERLAAGLQRVRQSVQRGVSRGKITPEEAEVALGRIRGTVDLEDFRPADLVIEAVTEDMNIKKAVFRRLDAILRPDVILASNTSSLSVAALAAVTQRPDRVLGMHFFNPVPVMALLELVRSILTSDETLATAQAIGARLGKTTVVAPDRPGFIVNRLLIPYIIDAIKLYEAGLASKEDIDTAIKLGLAHPMGPLTLADLVGLDTTLAVADVLYEEYGEARFKAPPLLRRMVAAGLLGRKSGRGFYDYR